MRHLPLAVAFLLTLGCYQQTPEQAARAQSDQCVDECWAQFVRGFGGATQSRDTITAGYGICKDQCGAGPGQPFGPPRTDVTPAQRPPVPTPPQPQTPTQPPGTR